MLADEYSALEAAASELCAAVAAAVGDGSHVLLHDTINNALHLRRAPQKAAAKRKVAAKRKAAGESGASSKRRRKFGFRPLLWQ